MVTIEYKKAITEVLDILEHTDDKLVNKIPKSLIEFWKRNKADMYVPNLDHSKNLSEMDLSPKTKAIIAMLYMQYWNK